ncbi:hypothetical protein EC991_008159 [Linnemannia zychae]|nr:hypothetical protein EC991_008159 [Linnemannia zychae]
MTTSGSGEWGYTFAWDRNLSTEELFLRICEYDGVNASSEGEEVEVFFQVFFDSYDPEVVVLGRYNRFAVRLDFGVCLWQLPTSRGGSFTLLTFEPSDHPLSALGESVGAIRDAERILAEDPKVAQRSLTEDLKIMELQLQALKDVLHRLETEDDDIGYPALCNHGKIIRWPASTERVRPVITLDISQPCYFGNQEALKCVKFIPNMLEVFVDGEALLTATFDYLMRHINRYPDYSNPINNSVIGALVMHCEAGGCEYFLRGLLKNTTRSWVPHASLFSSDPERDIFGILSKHSQRTMIQELADYMLESARRGNRIEPLGNSGYLDLLLRGLPHIAKRDPSMALWIIHQAAFLPSDYHRMYLVHDAVLNNPPWQQAPFWKKVFTRFEGVREFKNELYEYINPIFQVQSQLPLMIGPSSLSPEPRCFPKIRENNGLNDEIKLEFYMAPVSMAFSVPMLDLATPLQTAAKISSLPWIGRWLKMLPHLLKFGHAPKAIDHALPLEAYDSPALQAIMEFKWSRFARTFWIIRFAFQIIYYTLLLSVSFSQINQSTGDYSDDGQFVHNVTDNALRGEFISILVIGFVFLQLELRQVRGNWRRHLTVYNALDMFVYLLPMIIFELRVFKNICHVVTIIIKIMVRVPSFFFILAVFVLAFAHSLLHLIQIKYQSICPTPSNGNYSKACTETKPAFPKQYFNAVTTTYFFIVGKYDAVADSMGQGQAAIQIMVAFFVFLTAILMLNVVIALMNAGYGAGAAEALLVWLRNRVEVVARAENLSYLIPNYRHERDNFPRYIFYTATEAQVRSFAKKYDRPELLEGFPKMEVESSVAEIEAAKSAKTAARDIKLLKEAIQEMEKARTKDSEMMVKMLQEIQKTMARALDKA